MMIYSIGALGVVLSNYIHVGKKVQWSLTFFKHDDV